MECKFLDLVSQTAMHATDLQLAAFPDLANAINTPPFDGELR